MHQTDPRRRDSDGGGRGDGEEVLFDGTNPLVRSDDLLDSDGDGLTNALEAALGTNPFSVDTDGDLLTDAQENPDFDASSQGDGNENGIFEPELGEETDPDRALTRTTTASPTAWNSSSVPIRSIPTRTTTAGATATSTTPASMSSPASARRRRTPITMV